MDFNGNQTVQGLKVQMRFIAASNGFKRQKTKKNKKNKKHLNCRKKDVDIISWMTWGE